MSACTQAHPVVKPVLRRTLETELPAGLNRTAAYLARLKRGWQPITTHRGAAPSIRHARAGVSSGLLEDRPVPGRQSVDEIDAAEWFEAPWR